MTGLGLAPVSLISKRLRPSQWRRFICHMTCLSLLPVLMSCEMAQNKIQASRAGSEVTSISKITPIAAKPNEVVSLTGSNFYEAKNLKVSLELANGERATVPLAITNTTAASFIMPDGVGLGVKDVTLTQGTAQVEVLKFNLIADQADNQLPIVVGDESTVCGDQQYIDRNGETKTGTKDCASGVTPPACSENGSIGCVTTETYKSADLTNLSASSIKSGVTIAGVTGTVTQSPSNCASDGDVGCVVVGPSFAAAATTGAASKILSGQSVAGVSGNVTLPAVGKVLTSTQYGVSGTDSTGTLTLPSASNVLAGSGTYGEPGALMTPALTDRGTWNLTASFPGAGYYAGISDSPEATTIASGTTITGVAGSAVLRPADCSVDGGVGCVVVGPSFAAAATTGAASKILSGQSVAGVSGNVTLPAVGKVLSSTQYGVSGTGSTGTLTLPSVSNVLAGSGTYGDPGALMTPSLANQGTWDLTTSFPGAGYYSGTTNAPTDATIATGTTITGVAGSATLKPADCSTNAVTGCVTTSTYKSADLTNLSAGNIKSGVTIAGVAGQYPSSIFPLPNSSGSDLTTATFNAQIKSSGTFQYFGSDGVRYTGTGDSDISAANIASGVDIFGATGSLTGAVAPDAWNVRVGVTVNGVTGKLKVNCRNRVSTSSPPIYNYDGVIGSIGQAGQTGGSVRDIWDTIDDYNNGQAGVVPGGIVASWSSSTDCYGVESGAGDDNVWKDVTTTNGTTASTCTATPANCTMQDKITRLSWSKMLSTGAGQAWNTALATCAGLTYNGQTGWRLPTQKELMEAYTHGIRSAAQTNWMTEATMFSFWSGSSVSYIPNAAWYVNLSSGDSNASGTSKGFSYQVVCVR